MEILFQFQVRQKRNNIQLFPIIYSPNTRNYGSQLWFLAVFHSRFEYFRFNIVSLFPRFHHLEMEYSDSSKGRTCLFDFDACGYMLYFHSQFTLECTSFHFYLYNQGNPQLFGCHTLLRVKINKILIAFSHYFIEHYSQRL